jgi:hypothetical protein
MILLLSRAFISLFGFLLKTVQENKGVYIGFKNSKKILNKPLFLVVNIMELADRKSATNNHDLG